MFTETLFQEYRLLKRTRNLLHTCVKPVAYLASTAVCIYIILTFLIILARLIFTELDAALSVAFMQSHQYYVVAIFSHI
jgi:hypothetical protein